MAVKTKSTRKTTEVSSPKKAGLDVIKNPLKNQLNILNIDKKKLPFIIAFVLILVLVGFLFNKGFLVAALVNGEPITRASIIQTIEKQSGKATLESLITKRLILQEAKKRNVAVGQKDIDAEIKKIETNLKGQGTTLDQALSLQGMTKAQLVSEIEVQIALQKLVSSDVKVSDKEVEEFLTTNKDQFPEGTTEEAMKKEATDQIKSQKLQEKTQTFIKSLQDKAKIRYFVQY
ncbi:MAG: hypothetical protein ACD_37C00091G0003 [uncultured bacterium]|nr:MAG: hypothetical protein ACD_37C00091G0003 [uncultured bacterium]